MIRDEKELKNVYHLEFNIIVDSYNIEETRSKINNELKKSHNSPGVALKIESLPLGDLEAEDNDFDYLRLE